MLQIALATIRREHAVERDDRGRVPWSWVGRRVTLKLPGTDSQTVSGTLEDAHASGAVLSRLENDDPEMKLFFPWTSVEGVRETPLHGGLPVAEPPELAGEMSARTLRRVVPICQKDERFGLTVALVSLELYAAGEGVLRYLIHYGGTYDESGIAVLELTLVDKTGRSYDCHAHTQQASDHIAEGEIRISGLPDSGSLEVEITRVLKQPFDTDPDSEEGYVVNEGPWSFRFSL